MIFGAFAIFFTGYPHVWSIYQPYVMEQAGWSQGQASMCFYLALSTFVFGNIVGGRMQNHFKEKTIVWIGGGIFAAGILASAFLIVPTPVPMYLTYGVMQGFGQGMIYTVILATVQRWFPDRTGFASGVVVTANGLCGFFLAPLSRKLLEAEGVQKTLLIVGVAITVSWILCGIFFQAPEKSLINAGGSGVKAGTPEVKQYTSGEMMRTKNFYLLLATMFFGLTSYFMVSPVSQTYQIDLGIPSAVAVSAVMLGSIVNAGARLVLPTLADKVGRIVCIKGVLIVAVIAMGGLFSIQISGSNRCRCSDVRLLRRYHGKFPVSDKFHFRNEAHRGKLWICHVWYRIRNLWRTGNFRPGKRQWLWNERGIWNRSCFCGDRICMPDFAWTKPCKRAC